MKQLTFKLFMVIGIITLGIGCKKDNKAADASVRAVALEKTTATLKIGETATLTYTIFPANAANKNVTWTTSDQTVATVDNKGVVTAVKPGSATITVTTAEGAQTSTCSVTVTKNDAVSVSGNVEGTW